jgi:hypothetical protein
LVTSTTERCSSGTGSLANENGTWIAGPDPGVPVFDVGGIIVPGDPPPNGCPTVNPNRRADRVR